MSRPYFKADCYSHHFVITELAPGAHALVESFAKNYIQYGLIKVGRRFVRAPSKVFAAKTANNAEYRFHIEQWPAFTKHLSNHSIQPHNYEVVTHEPDLGQEIEIKTLPHWKEKDYQIPIGEYLVSDKPSRIKLLEIQTGKGKDAPLYTKIKVPGGWTTMGEIEEGQAITAWDGTCSRVTGVYPQGEKDIYKVTFADDRFTYAGAGHLWQVYCVNTSPDRRWHVVDTLEVKRLISMPASGIYVPLCKSEVGEDIQLPVDPYILGAVLGDGHIGDTTIEIFKHDLDLFENIKARLPGDMELLDTTAEKKFLVGKERGRNPYLQALRDLKLQGRRSWNKFIPELYLHASTRQRLALLQGLMDTGETASALESDGVISYSSTSHELAKGVQYLVRSLGGAANLSFRQTRPAHNDENAGARMSFDVSICYPKSSDLFTIKRKKECVSDDNQCAKDFKLRVVSVEPAGREQTQCISIDHPDQLYITDDFIVTHNTFCALNAATRLGKRIALIVKPAYIDKWISDFKTICGIERDEIVVVQGSAQIMAVIDRAQAGLLTEKAIIFSNRTLQNWFSLYEDKGAGTLNMGYGCLPHELFPTLKVGLRIIDEVHQDFHLNFKVDLYTHVGQSISLSATLKSDDAFMNRMYETAYPLDKRYAGLAYDKYVTAYSWIYHVKKPQMLRWNEYGSLTYSHHAFEKSIMKHDALLESYMDMILVVIRRFYLNEDYVKGDRLLVYCASIELCTRLTAFLKSVLQDKDVRRYVEDDPYENLMEAEISVSTLLSAGTGHDIARLTTVILTTSVLSHQSNVQGFGRLRRLEDRKTRFIYFACADVPKQLEYHLRKRELLATIALDYNTITYPHQLG